MYVGANMARRFDGLCRYDQFDYRNEGKIPCVAVGHADQIEDDDPKAEITGLYFQRVNEGIVKPVLGTDLFSPVNWRNSRINLRRIRENFRADMQLNLIVPPPRWSRFATVMSELYSWMLERMRLHNEEDTLLEGFRSEIWTDRNGQELSGPDTYRDKDAYLFGIGNADTEPYMDFLQSFISGFANTEGIKSLMNHLLTVDDRFGNIKRKLITAPEASRNQPIVNGVVHCLVYGFHRSQVLRQLDFGRDQERNGRARERIGRGRERIERRLLLPKCNGDRQRSRSRSASPVNDIESNVERIGNINPRNWNRNPNIQQILDNPDDFILECKSLYHYFEPHKPDYLVMQDSSQKMEVKLVIEVSSYKKHTTSTYDECLSIDTEQCVQQCMAGISYNQQKIQGLLIRTDGLKLVSLKKIIEANQARYEVYETEFIKWRNSQGICMILHEIKEFLMEEWGQHPWNLW